MATLAERPASAASQHDSLASERLHDLDVDRSASERDHWTCGIAGSLCLTVVVAGASGDLAHKKTYPALQFLFDQGFLPPMVAIVGYARTKMTDEHLRARLRGKLGGTDAAKERFLKRCTYVAGAYDGAEGWQALAAVLGTREKAHPCCPAGRLYYLALPPTVYPEVCTGLKTHCNDMEEREGSWIRLIVEKPFGRDLASSEQLASVLGALYPEQQIYRIGEAGITFKEDFGTQGRGGYFDTFGIIRDVIQNHITQLLAFVAMEKPVSIHPGECAAWMVVGEDHPVNCPSLLSPHPSLTPQHYQRPLPLPMPHSATQTDDIRDEKVRVLRCIKPPSDDQVVLGQYTAGDGEPGYLDDPTVPAGSKTPTFAACVLYVDNDRWSGVPFILRAGKALNDRKAEIRIQMRSTPHFIFGADSDPEQMRNELVIRLQPSEAIYLKCMVKKPGLDMDAIISELDLDYKRRFPGTVIPDAYPKLILDAIRGDQQHFVRRDELRAAWAIFTPLLHRIDAGEVPVHLYPAGSRGPAASEELLQRAGFVRNVAYNRYDVGPLLSNISSACCNT
eukprot:scaffold29.g5935.t1